VPKKRWVPTHHDKKELFSLSGIEHLFMVIWNFNMGFIHNIEKFTIRDFNSKIKFFHILFTNPMRAFDLEFGKTWKKINHDYGKGSNKLQ